MRRIYAYDEDQIRQSCEVDKFTAGIIWTEEEIQQILSKKEMNRLFEKMILTSRKIFERNSKYYSGK